VKPPADEPGTHRGTRAVQRMLEYAPAGGALALWMEHVAADEPREIPAWTDGRRIFYGPAFAALPLPQQTGWVAHEVLHIALRHAQRATAWHARTGRLDERLWNLCADAVVNSALAHLAWLELPAQAPRLETLLERLLGQKLDAAAALAQWDVERLYAALDDDPPDGKKSGHRASTARAMAAAGQSEDLEPAAGEPDEAPEAEAESARAWRERLLRAHAGDAEFSLLRTLLADLPAPRTPWEQVLRTQAAHALSRRPGLSWSRPTRSWLANQGRSRAGRNSRLPWEPGRTTSSDAPRLVVVIDTSGSIDEALLRRFGTELDALARRLEAALVLVLGDDRVRAVHRLRPGRDSVGPHLQAPGGGGTDFSPLLEEAERHAPDLIVVLTDLQGPADFRPRAPVLWAVPPAWRDAERPFGRRLVLD
jgi:predicted metal-dependent peptidase